jgi:hypothetical protein
MASAVAPAAHALETALSVPHQHLTWRITKQRPSSALSRFIQRYNSRIEVGDGVSSQLTSQEPVGVALFVMMMLGHTANGKKSSKFEDSDSRMSRPRYSAPLYSRPNLHPCSDRSYSYPSFSWIGELDRNIYGSGPCQSCRSVQLQHSV